MGFAFAAFSVYILCASSVVAEPPTKTDWRAFDSGHRIFSSGYIDQPYVVVLGDNAWFCVFTTGAGHEGAGGQHIVASRSSDQGRTWAKPIDIEPADGPAASWAMPYQTKYGRVYVFYDYNGEKVDTLNGRKIRNDMLGWYCYKFTDDGGLTWSDRYRLPTRTTACDRANDFQGKVHIFWGIDKADDIGKGMMFGFTKLGKYMLDLGEGWFFRCDNINTEKDPAQLDWQMLPDGDHGLRHPDFGSIQEEHNLVPLSDGTLYCVYRTRLGYPAESYSRDGGKSWSEPRRMRYADGSLIKNSRACPRLFRCSNGKYLFWYHNHSGTGYEDRNPAWLAGGIEKNGRMLWSQPEILIYSHDTSRATGRFSYPDLIQQDGRYWTTCTNKETGRVHEIPVELLEGLWAQLEGHSVRELATPVVTCAAEDLAGGKADLCPANGAGDGPVLDSARDSGGITIDLTLRLDRFQLDETIFDSRDSRGRGIHIATIGDRQLEIFLSTGEKNAQWTTDLGLLATAGPHRVTAVIDDGPNIITWTVNGRLCDGGASRQYGWTRYDRQLGKIPLPKNATVASKSVVGLRLFDRPLRTSEVVGLHKTPRKN